jgi:hypothetical protein
MVRVNRPDAVTCLVIAKGAAERRADLAQGSVIDRYLPVYDHLSEKFCICDRWYSSVAGSTLPNRLYAMAGRAAGKRDNDSPPIYHLPSFVRHLDNLKGVSWTMFVHDLTPILWAVDNDYPFNNLIDEHVAWFDGHFRPPYFGDGFIQQAAAGKLPSVSWIDPSFADLRTGLISEGGWSSLEGGEMIRIHSWASARLEDLRRTRLQPELGKDAVRDHLRRAWRLL